MDSNTADTVRAAAVLGRLRVRAPRVHCLTNTVAQQITANVLLAVGARVSMATHLDEVADMATSADAVLFNLGTLDAARLMAIPRLLSDKRLCGLPRVLDPVFVEYAPNRRALALEIMAAGALIVKGNAAELAVLDLPASATRVETGAVDRISGAGNGGPIAIARGHRWMAQVTGMGCAAGAFIAACAAVESDPIQASAAALTLFGIAGECAALKAHGPGSFAVAFLDAMAGLDPETLG